MNNKKEKIIREIELLLGLRLSPSKIAEGLEYTLRKVYRRPIRAAVIKDSDYEWSLKLYDPYTGSLSPTIGFINSRGYIRPICRGEYINFTRFLERVKLDTPGPEVE